MSKYSDNRSRIFSPSNAPSPSGRMCSFALRILNSVLVMNLLVGLFPVSGSAASFGKFNAIVSPSGAIRIEMNHNEFGTLLPSLFEASWRGALMTSANIDCAEVGDVCYGKIRASSGASTDCETRISTIANGLHLAYKITPTTNMQLNGLYVGITIPVGYLVGGSCIVDGKQAKFPEKRVETHLLSGDARSVEIRAANGSCLEFKLASPTPILIQDDRIWGPTFCLRIGPQYADPVEWPAGKSFTAEFDLISSTGMSVEYDAPVTIEPGKDWIPLDPGLDIEAGSALDLSGMVSKYAPAGKSGRVVVGPNGSFAFANEPKKPVRFYGVNLCFTGQYMTHEEADRLATRLQRLGYNAVRFHHYEGTLIDYSDPTHTKLNSEMLDKFDYLFAALKKRGIYATTDIFVSRPVLAKEVWENEQGDIPQDIFKIAVPVNERAFSNYKAFATSFLTHKNPYTDMSYAKDPALGWLSLINEGNPVDQLSSMSGHVADDWKSAWNKWLTRKYPSRDDMLRALGLADANGAIPMPKSIDNTPLGIQASLFIADVERDFVKRMRAFLGEELGCKALLTDTNAAWNYSVQMYAGRRDFDYVDDHFYFDHPYFLDFLANPWSLPSSCSNASPVASQGISGCYFSTGRMIGKPFTVTEFNYAWPSAVRGASGMLTGALGAFQGWSAIYRFAYSHGHDEMFSPSGSNYFDLAADPLNLASDRAALFLFLRHDLQPAKHIAAAAISMESVFDHPKTTADMRTALSALAFVTRVGTAVTSGKSGKAVADVVVDPYDPAARDKVIAQYKKHGWLKPNNRTNLTTGVCESDTREVLVDSRNDVFSVDTPRTAGGSAVAGTKIQTKMAEIEIQDQRATVWVSSLDGKPINESRRLLVTHLTDMQNAGAKFGDKARKVLVSSGGLPYLVHSGRAVVKICLKDAAKANVWGLSVSGARTSQVKTRIENGVLVVPLDVNAGGKARMLYEVTVTK